MPKNGMLKTVCEEVISEAVCWSHRFFYCHCYFCLLSPLLLQHRQQTKTNRRCCQWPQLQLLLLLPWWQCPHRRWCSRVVLARARATTSLAAATAARLAFYLFDGKRAKHKPMLLEDPGPVFATPDCQKRVRGAWPGFYHLMLCLQPAVSLERSRSRGLESSYPSPASFQGPKRSASFELDCFRHRRDSSG